MMKPLEALITVFVICSVLGVALAYSWDAGVWDKMELTGIAVSSVWVVATAGALSMWLAWVDA